MLEDQTRVLFFLLMWLLVSRSVPGWETVCSQAGRQFLVFTKLKLGDRASVPSSPRDTKHSPPKHDTFGFLQCFSQTTPPSAFSLDFFFFSVRNPSHSGGKKNPTVSIVSKTCLFSARSVYRAPVSSQLSLQTEKPETLWEVIFQSTKTGALEISADVK